MNLSRKTIRIVKALALLSALTIEVLILFSFFSPWYHYYDINQVRDGGLLISFPFFLICMVDTASHLYPVLTYTQMPS